MNAHRWAAGIVVALATIAATATTAPAAPAAPTLGLDRVVLQTNAGDIVLGLYPQVAPKTVAHVVDLARSGALDGADFFRVVPGFVVQLDANQRATPLPPGARSVVAQTVPLEVGAGLRHQRGVLSMAHYDGKPDSGGPSFSILLGAAPNLDGKFTIFGDVERGMDVVDEMAAAPLAGSRPITPIVVARALVTDAAGVAALNLRGAVPLGGSSAAGPVSTWPRLLLSTSMGDVLVTLSPRDAPQHVKLVEALVGAGAYNGASLGRAAPGAYVQWFASRPAAATAPLAVERGTVGNVAGALTIDSTDKEQAPALTLLLSDNHGLDGRYTAVGWVTQGSVVVDALARLPTGADHRPHQLVSIEKATIVPAGTTVVVRGLTTATGAGVSSTPWGAFGFLAAAVVIGLLIFLFSKRLTPPLVASAGLLVVLLGFLGLWVGLVPHSNASSQWLGVGLFAGAIGVFRLMGRFERGRAVPPPAPIAPPEPDGPAAVAEDAVPVG